MNTYFWIGVGVGLFFGMPISFVIYALLAVGSNASRLEESWKRAEIHRIK